MLKIQERKGNKNTDIRNLFMDIKINLEILDF